MLYDSWEEWTRHEQWAHQQRIWRCSEHPQREYAELATYEDHVRAYHVASVYQLLSSELLNSQQSVSQVCDRPCPFCQRDFDRSIDLQQHIASHLESIALLSLPNLDKIDESSEVSQKNSNSANRNYAESRASDFDATEPLIFSENDILKDSSVMTKTKPELFNLKLQAESISYESMNEVNIEARQAYSSELSGEWLSHLPDHLDEEMEIRSPGPGNQEEPVVLVRDMQELVDTFAKFRDRFRDQETKTDITNLMAEIKSLSVILRKVNIVIRAFPHPDNYDYICDGFTDIKVIMHLICRDVRQRLVVLDRGATISTGRAHLVWESINLSHAMQGERDLASRVALLRRSLQELMLSPTEG